MSRTNTLLNLWFLTVCLIYANISQSQGTPPNLNSDINWTDTGGEYDPSTNTYDATFNGVVDIEAAFNNGRRQEEIQLGIATNALGNLVLPGGYNSMSDDAKALFILNAERMDRIVLFGNAGVTPDGLPFEAIEYNIDQLAQHHADYLAKNDAFSHNGPCGKDPFERIDEHPLIGVDVSGSTVCHEFISRGENLAVFWTTGPTVPLVVERSIYHYIYDDAGSAWGHREACLYQGFNNNHGSSASEGFLGIATSELSGSPWNKFFMVMNFFDPVPTDCNGAYILSPSPSLSTNIPTGNMTYFADYEFTETSGWTNYYDDNGTRLDLSDDFLLFSINRSGDFIGRIMQTSSCGMDVKIGNGSGCVDLSTSNYVTNPNGWFVMNRFYDVTVESQPSSSQNVKMYYSSTNYNDVAGAGCASGLTGQQDLTFYKVTTGIDPDPNSGSHATMSTPADINFLDHGSTPSTTIWNYSSFGSDHCAEFQVASYSGGGGGGASSGGSPLPVTLLTFEADLNSNETVTLKWVTVNEINSSHYNIEKSKDGIHFDLIGTKISSNNIQSQNTYEMVDLNPFKGWNYYRLVQIDEDGSSNFGEIKSIYIPGEIELSLSPNPFRNAFQINLNLESQEDYILTIYGISGNLVKQLNLSSLEQQTINMEELESGPYFVKITTSGGLNFVRKVVKVH